MGFCQTDKVFLMNTLIKEKETPFHFTLIWAKFWGKFYDVGGAEEN